jgi:hypothetical protein
MESPRKIEDEEVTLGRRAVFELARVRGVLEEGLSKAAVLRTETVHVWATQAREFVAIAKRLEEESLSLIEKGRRAPPDAR